MVCCICRFILWLAEVLEYHHAFSNAYFHTKVAPTATPIDMTTATPTTMSEATPTILFVAQLVERLAKRAQEPGLIPSEGAP